jgi:2-polyprenyl-6-methoxyphenol hydroxylase-like FAD-dependent oxidoreductase
MSPSRTGRESAGSLPAVLIVGAGPTGLVLALWLTRLGVPVRIIDRAAQPGTTSRALAVQARTLELYQQIGIADDVVAGGVKVPALNLWVSGRKRARIQIDAIGEGLSPFAFALVYPQDAHEKLLIEHLERAGVRVERETELVHLEQHPDGVRATLRTSAAGEEVFETAYVAGCDGASSMVRHQLGIEFPGGTYQGYFYVADVHAPSPLANDELHIDIEDVDFLLVFPLKGAGNLRMVGLVHEHEKPDRQFTFDDVQGRAVDRMQLGAAEVNWFSTYRVHHRVAPRFRAGRAFLLGDAAHVHSPVGGQGMNTGIGDAVNLAWKLAAVLKGEADAAAILDTYEPERIAFARRLVETTDRGFTIVTRQGKLARLVRTRLVPAIAPAVFRVPAMRRLFFRTVSQINVSYHDSALSEGKAGAIVAGDRLPWIKSSNGPDNFAPLRSLEWQVHVYGRARDDLKAACSALHIALYEFEWNAAARDAGVRDGALYLIRPDGYVGLADAEADVSRLRDHVARFALRSAD